MVGESGLDKTHPSTSLGTQVVNQSYQVSFVPMYHLVYILKTQEYIRKASTLYKNMEASDLIISDDIIYIAYELRYVRLFFHFSKNFMRKQRSF